MTNEGKSNDQLQRELIHLQQQHAWEKAAANIRFEVLSMGSSQDLLSVTVMAFRELWGLGLEIPACTFFFVDQNKDRVFLCCAFTHPHCYGNSWTSPELIEIDEKIAAIVMDEPIDDGWEEDLNLLASGRDLVVEPQLGG